jgi:hypothetical protein
MEPTIWLMIFAAATLVSVLAGAGWKVFGSQLQALKDQIDRMDKESIQLASTLRHEQEIREKEVKEQIEKRVSDSEFKQFEKRSDSLEAQLNILQATRPTTGELKAEANGLSARITLLEQASLNGKKM